MAKHYLLTPGPTPVPEEIQAEMAKPIIHHRTPQYKEIFSEASRLLKKVFKTGRDVITITSSGTGAMEASIINTLSKGDTAIVVRGGKFGERFAGICEAYGVNVVPVDIAWGTAPDPGLIDKALKDNKQAKAVFINQCETSTATVYDVKAIAAVVSKTPAILVVDAISGLGADELETDAWGVDIVVGGSQKGLMIPPGLSFCALSEKAWAMASKSDLPKFYLNLKKYKKSL
ncbi:MAG: aminotransferase class V-fold PLP-dependent enzyme, partial [Candidatus Omnitrophota bacterium]